MGAAPGYLQFAESSPQGDLTKLYVADARGRRDGFDVRRRCESTGTSRATEYIHRLDQDEISTDPSA
ncbi:hypothetical protein [Streptomyces mirabilis]|uniref:hypothetical protein n=1 Tax=Streptomyces mirabilis TaxID=68239 RepID=UPI0036789880